MLELRLTNRFKKDVKLAERQGKPMRKLHSAIESLRQEEPLPPQLRDHLLTGDYVGHRECHLSPDWLLIYKVDTPHLILVRTGSHSELFD